MSVSNMVIAPGTRVVVRDAEWLVRKVNTTSTGGRALTVIGLSELEKDKEAVFLDEIDRNIEILDPADTRLVMNSSRSYQKSLLYMESLLRLDAADTKTFISATRPPWAWFRISWIPPSRRFSNPGSGF